jgi:hypothetical protein
VANEAVLNTLQGAPSDGARRKYLVDWSIQAYWLDKSKLKLQGKKRNGPKVEEGVNSSEALILYRVWGMTAGKV